MALQDLGHPETVIERFGDKPTVASQSFWASGRSAELAERFPDLYDPDVGYYHAGRYAERLANHPNDCWCLILTGQCDRALEYAASATPPETWVFRVLGRLDLVKGKERESFEFLVADGQFEEVDRRFHDSWTWGMWPRHLRGLQAYLRGDIAGACRLFTAPPRLEFHQYMPFPLEHAVLVPLLEECAGDADAFARADAWSRAHPFCYQQQPLHYARWLSGEIDDAAFLAQPHRVRAPADLALLIAVRHDRQGRRADAVAAYRAYLVIPTYVRHPFANPFIEGVVTWRIEQLSKP
jgi:hypothetical protein